MGWKSTEDSKVDPSGIKQQFAEINLNVHCCRYWKLHNWELNNMSFPFWRLYYNTLSGASVYYKHNRIDLNGTKVLLIPPYTPFSTTLKNAQTEQLSGNRIESKEELIKLEELNMTDHLFLHFNLGFQLDHLKPDIYEFFVDDKLNELLTNIRFSIIENYQHVEYNTSIQIYYLILNLIAKLPATNWTEYSVDTRVMKVIDFIENNYQLQLSNKQLAQIANMAPNSFLRLFKSATSKTLQNYIQNKRIEKAILSMHNENASIEEIAEQNGFCDRFNFSKVFKRYVNMSPAQYRKQHTLN